jgi:hypothetical protein
LIKPEESNQVADAIANFARSSTEIVWTSILAHFLDSFATRDLNPGVATGI